MNLETKELKIKTTTETKQYWINREFISETKREKIKDSNILFIPEIWKEGIIGFQKEAFPFYEYLEEQNSNKLNIDFCIEDENYQELHLHSDVIWMGTILIEFFFLPLFINLLSSYISNHIFHDSDDEINIKLNIQKGNEKNVILEYNGNCDDFIKIINDEHFCKLIDKTGD